jgi:hypothetical protein
VSRGAGEPDPEEGVAGDAERLAAAVGGDPVDPGDAAVEVWW